MIETPSTVQDTPSTSPISTDYDAADTVETSATASGAENLTILRNIKIGSFNIGSAFADILGSGVWNRIMIADLGYAATPVSLLLGINYFLAPLVVLTGQRSDHTNINGYRRLPWIWSGRLLIVLGFFLLPFVTVELANTGDQIWWLGITAALGLTAIGSLLSGSAYSALIYDRAPAHQRGRAVGVAWTMILFGFAFSGVLFAQLLPAYSTSGVITLFTTVSIMMGFLWVVSVWGEERRLTPEQRDAMQHETPETRSFANDFREVWSRSVTRLFFLYIGLSFTGAFAQDQILEPFGGEVFDLSTGETSRFAAFWGTTALIGSIVALYMQRRISTMNYARINRWGVYLLISTFVLLTITALGEIAAMLRPTLILFGAGLGMWNIGAWGLMVSVSNDARVGTYFGLWTMASLLFRGGGQVLGAAIRDVTVFLTETESLAYGLVFALEAGILVLSLIIVNRIRFEEQIDDATQEQVLVAVSAD